MKKILITFKMIKFTVYADVIGSLETFIKEI